MIAPLRRGHRLIFALLAIALPLLLMLALAARRSTPVEPIPAGLAVGSGAAEPVGD